jgi:hypothetical protein
VHSSGPRRRVGSPLRIGRAERRVFGGRSDSPLDPELRRFVEDMVRPYGNALREDLLAEANGHAYAVMAEALIETLVPPDRPVDLLVLASAIHDTQLARPSATYLSYICPGRPMAFAVCDQGSAGAHTALRLVRDQVGAGSRGRSLLVLVEQPVLHYEPTVLDGPSHLAPRRPAAVAFLCDEYGGAELLSVRQHSRVAPAAARELLAAEVSTLLCGPSVRDDVTIVLGEGLASLAGDVAAQLTERVVRAPGGQPFTGAWWELAAAMDGLDGLSDPHGSGGGLVVLADYEPQLRYLSVTAVDLDPSPHELPVALPRQVSYRRSS